MPGENAKFCDTITAQSLVYKQFAGHLSSKISLLPKLCSVACSTAVVISIPHDRVMFIIKGFCSSALQSWYIDVPVLFRRVQGVLRTRLGVIVDLTVGLFLPVVDVVGERFCQRQRWFCTYFEVGDIFLTLFFVINMFFSYLLPRPHSEENPCFLLSGALLTR